MKIQGEKAELLHTAFSRFNSASTDLEQCYRLLKEHVRHLNLELESKNRALVQNFQEKEALREQMERDSRLAAIGEMAARMAHELRNPLGSIELFASLLKDELEDHPEQKQWAGHISTAVKAMDNVLSNLLLFTGKPHPYFRNSDLRKTILEAVSLALPQFQQNNIRLTQSMEKLPDRIKCDEDLMRQVLLNLILNAIDAMPSGGDLAITARVQDTENDPNRRIMITVSDTGIGIPKEVLPRIFDPFFTTKKNGTGLGLAIVHNAIQAHHGKIQVKSHAGQGTTFSLLLPSSSRNLPTESLRSK